MKYLEVIIFYKCWRNRVMSVNRKSDFLVFTVFKKKEGNIKYVENKKVRWAAAVKL